MSQGVDTRLCLPKTAWPSDLVLNLNYPTGNQIRERSAPIIKEMIEKAGVKVNMRQPKEAKVYYDDLEKNAQDWDLYLAGWSLGSTDKSDRSHVVL